MANDFTPEEYTLIELFGVTPDQVMRLHQNLGTPGHVCIVESIPQCSWCDKPGPVDFKTSFGPWAHGCFDHWVRHRDYAQLGTGRAQVWVKLGE